MDQSTALEAVQFFKDRLQERGVHVARLILFGSRAAATAAEDSDVDVVLVSDDFQGKSIFERSRLAGPAEAETIRRFQVPLDVVLMSPEEFASERSIVAHAARTGGMEQ